MSCGCSTAYRDDGIEGMDETDMMLMGGAVGGYMAAAYVDNMLIYDKDGNKKTGGLAENDNMRNGAFVGAGVALNWFMPDEPLAKGAGIGMAVFGVKELFKSQYPTAGIKGNDPRYIAGANQRNGDPKYIGKARSSRVDLGLNQTSDRQMQKQGKLIVKHN